MLILTPRLLGPAGIDTASGPTGWKVTVNGVTMIFECVSWAAKQEFGSPPWTRFELLRRETRSARTSKNVSSEQHATNPARHIQVGRPTDMSIELPRCFAARLELPSGGGIFK
jgi:hypothetical protein